MTFPNARDCEHGHQRGKCVHCDLVECETYRDTILRQRQDMAVEISRMRHRGDKINAQGSVSALCFPKPRAIDMKRDTWVMNDDAVTCPKCRALILARQEKPNDQGEQTLDAIACLKALQKMETPQLRKIHPLDFPIAVFLADLTTRPANIIRAELAVFASYAGTGTFDIEPPFTVRHLCMFSRSEMRKWPNFGRKCLNEVEEMLRARGLQLWENHDERSLRLLREHKEYFK